MNRPPELRLSLDGLIVDCFAGGGGASTGIEMACGRSPDIAINHDPQAIAMHKINHPNTLHLCENIREVSPKKLIGKRRVALAWFSPDCTFHSKARGGKPFRDRNKARRIRGLAWIVVDWAREVRPDVIMLENVEEFAQWGPLGEDGRPCPLRRGFTFRRWVAMLQNLGYEIDMRELRACDYGAPTTRKRLFVIARCDGKPIVWPEATHARGGARGLAPYRTAAECIDFSLPCPSIFLTKEEGAKVGAKRPLAENTMKRIARGLKKFVLDNPKPFIVGLAHGEHARGAGDRSHGLDEPVRTIQPGGNNQALVAPVVAKFRGESPGTAADAPLDTITAGPQERPAGNAHGMGLIEVLLARADDQVDADGWKRVDCNCGFSFVTNREHHICPKDTVYCNSGHVTYLYGEALAPFLTEHANASSPRSFPADDPLRTQCANVKGGHFAIVQPVIVGAGGPARAGEPADSGAPLGTILPKNDRALIAPIAVPRYGEREGQEPRAMSLEAPAPTIVPTQNGQQLVSAFLAKHFGGHETPGSAADLPIDTVTARDHHALVASTLTKFKGTASGADIEEPLHTVQAQGWHHGEVRAFLSRYNGCSVGQVLDQPMSVIDTTDRMGLVMVDGVPHAIVDIGMRMLKPRELYLCQGFPASYVIEFTYNGKPLPQDAQVRMVGNSVSPVIPAAMVRANFAETAQRGFALAGDD